MSERTPQSPPSNWVASDSNRAIAQRWFREVWNERKTETIDELFQVGAIGHTESGDQSVEEFKVAREGLLTALPDLAVTVDDTAADGDHVVVRWSARATHQGDGLGMPPTGQSVAFRGMTWLTFRDGKVIEGWDAWNLGGLLESLRTDRADGPSARAEN